METIWLQRPSGDIPWGFRLQGGQEFNQPLSVLRVTPGSVAANENGLTPGDVILKIGNVNATNISHNEAQEVICGASNILQLTIKKGAAPVSPTSPGAQFVNSSQSSGQFSPQQQQQPQFPDYRVGSGYQGGYVNDSRGYNNAQQSSPNNAYDMRQFEQTPPISGYSTLPARSGNRQTSDGFRPVPQDPQKHAFSSSAGIQLQSVPRNDGSYSQPMSPVQYNMNGNRNSDAQYQRQTSVGQQTDTNTGYQPSHFRKPTPFSSGHNYQNGSATLPLQRQTSSGQTNNVYGSSISPGYQPGAFSPKSDDAPPPPPPPANYQPEPYGRSPYDPRQDQYQRQTSQPQQNSYGGSPYEQQQNNYNNYQSRQPYEQQGPQYTRQGSRPYDSSPQQPQYQRQPSNQQSNFYDSRGNVPPPPSQQPRYDQNQQYNNQYTQQQPSYNRQPSREQQSQFSPPQQSYSRQLSREQQPPSQFSPPQPSYNRQGSGEQQPQYNRQPSQPMHRQSSREQHFEQPNFSNSPTGNKINSFDDILSPFENFQNSNYCDKLFARTPQDIDSGVSLSSDTPRSNQSSTYSPPQPYSSGFDDRGEVPEQQNLLRPAPPAPPPPPVTPPPPPPPPPPSDWSSAPKKKIPLEGGNTDIGGQESMPDKVLNTMLKNSGTQKPFAYVPTGADLKEFKERARQRRQPRNVMPRGLQSFEQDDLPTEAPRQQKSNPAGGVPTPESGVYKHAQYNSPLRMYSANNAKEAFSIQSGGNVDVSGVNNSTPERRPSDIKESEVYKMCQAADAQGKSPKKPRDPLLRHNSVDDEMRFSGFHTKADIPSKAFQRLNKMAVGENESNVPSKQKKSNQDDRTDEDNEVGNYDQTSIRYKGNYIPSPSFRLLQTLAKDDGGSQPGSDNESGSKIKVMNRSKSPVVPPKPDRSARNTPTLAPSTDF